MKKISIFLMGLIAGVVPTAFASSLIFSDVSEGDWYYSAVNNLSDMGIVEGYEDGTYRPSNDVNRAEMAVILDRLNDAIRNGCIYEEDKHDLGILEDPDDTQFFLDGDTVYLGDWEEYTCENGNIGGETWDPE